MNGAGGAGNQRAFEIGRWSVAFPEQALNATREKNTPQKADFECTLADRSAYLDAYQNAALAAKYRERVEKAHQKAPEFGMAMAHGYHKLLAYKDEYEVARLHCTYLQSALDEKLTDISRVKFHMAPPILARRDSSGHPTKSEFGPWMATALRLLSRMKFLRGTAFDPFGRSEERKMERALIVQYETDMDEVLNNLTPEKHDIAIALAELPLQIKGFGHVKTANAAATEKRREELLAAFRNPDRHEAQAAE